MPMNKAIAAALVRAQKDAKPLPRDGFNAHLKVAYVRAESFITAGREILGRHGLSVLPQEVTFRAEGTVNVERLRYTVSNEQGESEEFARELPFTHNAKISPTDGAAACDTRLMGYLYRGLLMIPQSDEVVDEHGEVTNGKHEEPPKQAPPSQNGQQQPDYGTLLRQASSGFKAKLEGLTGTALGDRWDALEKAEAPAWASYPPNVQASMARAFRYWWIGAKSKHVKDDADFGELKKDLARIFEGVEGQTQRRDELAAIIEKQQKHAHEQRSLQASAVDEGW